MNVDLFTLIVQLGNFFILMFILNKVLYKPLLTAMENRKKTINEKIDNAENKLLEAEQLKKEISKQIDEVKKYEKEEKTKIDNEVSDYKGTELEKMQNELEKQKQLFVLKLEDEKEEITKKISKNICISVGEFVNKLLISLSNQNLKETVFNNFIEEIKNLGEEQKNKIKKLKNNNIEFISSFELSENQQNKVKETLKNIDLNNNIKFLLDENVILGNKMQIDNLIINSNINNIVSQFTNKLQEMV